MRCNKYFDSEDHIDVNKLPFADQRIIIKMIYVIVVGLVILALVVA